MLVGGDSAGNQARGLAYYIADSEYIALITDPDGDIHTYNANKLTLALSQMGIDHEVPRSVAKRILYAFLFGAGGKKLWSYVFGVMDNKKGNKLKKLFTAAVPGFKELLDKLENIYGATKRSGHGYIPGIAGNRIYVDSFHKLLVYLLQACEKATCAGAVMLTMNKLEEEGIPYKPTIFYHDEANLRVPTQYAERTRVILEEAFKEGPKLFGIDIMAGDAKIGTSWLEIH